MFTHKLQQFAENFSKNKSQFLFQDYCDEEDATDDLKFAFSMVKSHPSRTMTESLYS